MSEKQTYEVGEILWVISSDCPGMLALQVVEVITKRTMQGEDIQYLVLNSRPKSTPVLLHTIQGRIFKDLEEARTALYTQATSAIDGIIEKIQQSAEEAFGTAKESPFEFMAQPLVPTVRKLSIKEEKEGNFQEVEMDGQIVKIKMPDL